MTPADLSALIRATTTDVLTGRGIGTDSLSPEIDWAGSLARPRMPNAASREPAADYATSVALRAATGLRLAPRRLAGWLADALAEHPSIDTAAVAGPGFVNLRLADDARSALVGEVLAAGDGYGVLGRAPEPAPADDPLDDVRYAHARLCALARHAEALEVPMGERYELLTEAAERELVAVLAEFPRAVDLIWGHTAHTAHTGDGGDRGGGDRPDPASPDPPRLARFLRRVTDGVHTFDASCRVLPMGDEPTSEIHSARRALCAAARQVLANGLRLLCVPAPERM
ncbi:MAG TPA: DALR anticodon-binding domain-containing protein [Pseudonocardia sp.]